MICLILQLWCFCSKGNVNGLVFISFCSSNQRFGSCRSSRFKTKRKKKRCEVASVRLSGLQQLSRCFDLLLALINIYLNLRSYIANSLVRPLPSRTLRSTAAGLLEVSSRSRKKTVCFAFNVLVFVLLIHVLNFS